VSTTDDESDRKPTDMNQVIRDRIGRQNAAAVLARLFPATKADEPEGDDAA
jgi:hypothetical protein